MGNIRILFSFNIVFLLLIIIVVISKVQGVCTPQSEPGTCEGKLQRSILLANNLTESNFGCAINQVPFFLDDDPENVMCGECTPGLGGWDDPSHSCKLDEYCTDTGVCKPIKNHPLFEKQCPFEAGTVPGWCGSGLRCYHHICLPCLNGMVDYSDGKMCVSNQWTYSRWSALTYNPSDTFSLFIFIFLLLAVLIPISVRIWTKYGKERAQKLLKSLKRNRKTPSNNVKISANKDLDESEDSEDSDFESDPDSDSQEGNRLKMQSMKQK